MSTFLSERPQMLDGYPDHVGRIEFEASWAWNTALSFKDSGERPDADMVTVALNQLVAYADRGWELEALPDLSINRGFITRRPGMRPGKDEKKALEALNPAQFIRSFFEQGTAFVSAPDDLVYAALLEYAKTYLSLSEGKAARRMNQAVVMGLALRAGAEPMSSAQIGV